jgi:hypothetical protein
MGYSSAKKQRRQMEAWLAARTRKGSQCSNCAVVFSVDHGDGKQIAIFPNGGGGIAFYVLCRDCGALYRAMGLAGLPEVQKDCRITVAMSPYNPANAVAFKTVH